MNTEEKEHQNLKKKFLIIAGVTLLVLSITTTVADILETNHSDSPALVALIIPSIPGFILYVLVTGIFMAGNPVRSDKLGELL